MLIILNIKQKFGLTNSGGRYNLHTETVQILLLNMKHGLETTVVDEENESTIAFFQTYGADIGKESATHSYWSKSVISIKKEQLDVINNALKLLTDTAPLPVSQMVARC